MAEGDGLPMRETPRRDEPDAHGQAALLLAESLLVEAKALTRDQALAAVRAAVSVKQERAAAEGESETRMRQSLRLLDGIERSMATIGRG